MGHAFDVATVALDDAVHRRESDAGAFEFAGLVQTLERLEQLVGVGHVEADTVVTHDEAAGAGTVLAQALQFDHRRGLVAGVFHGVAQQVLQHDAGQPQIAEARQARLDPPGNDTLRLLGLFRLHHLFGDVAEVGLAQLQFALADPGQGQQVGDQGAHAPGRGQHPMEQLLFVRGKATFQLFAQQTGESVDGPQRRFQVVRDGVGEGVELGVELFQFGRAQAHPLLQGRVELLDFPLAPQPYQFRRSPAREDRHQGRHFGVEGDRLAPQGLQHAGHGAVLVVQALTDVRLTLDAGEHGHLRVGRVQSVFQVAQVRPPKGVSAGGQRRVVAEMGERRAVFPGRQSFDASIVL